MRWAQGFFAGVVKEAAGTVVTGARSQSAASARFLQSQVTQRGRFFSLGTQVDV
jgi:hypothetical protein